MHFNNLFLFAQSIFFVSGAMVPVQGDGQSLVGGDLTSAGGAGRRGNP